MRPRRLQAHLLGAIKKQWKSYRKELKRCQRRFSEEAVHQSRVETRRLLSLLELLGPLLPTDRVERIRACLKRHLDTFDDLRDSHVQLLLLKRLRDFYPEARVFERYLRKRERRFDRQTRKNIKRIKTKRLGRWITACRKEVKAQETDTIALPLSRSFSGSTAALLRLVSLDPLLFQIVDTVFDRAAELRKEIDPVDTQTIHRTRVAFKKFRYMVEMLSGVLPVATPRRLEAMRRYQGLMGDVQDMEVLLRAFDKFSRKEPASAGEGGAFREDLLARRRRLVERYLARADQLYSFWPPARSSSAAPQSKPKVNT